jgi:hypothetical protein
MGVRRSAAGAAGVALSAALGVRTPETADNRVRGGSGMQEGGYGRVLSGDRPRTAARCADRRGPLGSLPDGRSGGAWRACGGDTEFGPPGRPAEVAEVRAGPTRWSLTSSSPTSLSRRRSGRADRRSVDAAATAYHPGQRRRRDGRRRQPVVWPAGGGQPERQGRILPSERSPPRPRWWSGAGHAGRRRAARRPDGAALAGHASWARARPCWPGGRGGVGTLLVQIAWRAGARPWRWPASRALALARDPGADVIVDYSQTAGRCRSRPVTR